MEYSYNTSLPKMIIPEYGRNIQKMIEFAMTIKDRDRRNENAKAIIEVMGQLNPHLRDVVDFKHKLWDHIFIISNFKLDVDSPYPMPTAETFKTKPDRIKIPSQKIKYKHYGKIAEDIILKAAEYPEGEEKDFLTVVIANMMKQNYLSWNRDTVNDMVIIDQMDELSHGKLKLKDMSQLKHTSVFVPRVIPREREHKRRSSGGGSKYGGGSGGSKYGGGGHSGKYKKKY